MKSSNYNVLEHFVSADKKLKRDNIETESDANKVHYTIEKILEKLLKRMVELCLRSYQHLTRA